MRTLGGSSVSTRVKVALVSEEFPPFIHGGIASFCYDLAHNLSKKGIPTRVICGRSEDTEVNAEKVNNNLEIVRLPFLNFPPRALWFQLQNISIFAKLVQECSIVHMVAPQAGAIWACLKGEIGRPLVTSVHDVPEYELRALFGSPLSHWSAGDFGHVVLEYPLNSVLAKVCLECSDHIIACSSTLAQEMKSVYGDFGTNRVSVVYNGIDFDRVGSMTQEAMSTQPYIIFYGRLVSRKGLIYLLKAFAMLRRNHRELKLKIFGDGPLAAKVRTSVWRAGLKDQISVHGHVPYTRLLQEIRGATLVAMPSLYEGQPIAALEAMSLGKPLIAFDVPYAREFITHNQNGLLAKAHDAEDLCEKMQFLLSDKDAQRRLGENARKHVELRHNWDRIVNEYASIYAQVLDRRSHS